MASSTTYTTLAFILDEPVGSFADICGRVALTVQNVCRRLEKLSVFWIVPGIIAAVVVIELLVRLPIIFGVVKVFEQSPGFGVEPAAPRDDAELVSFTSSHGLTIRGSLYDPPTTPSKGVVVYCPETGGNHWMAMNYIVALRDAGFTVVAFDFRNQSDSDTMPGYESTHWPTEYEVSDALAAIDFVANHEKLKSLPIGIFGVSRGGTVALAAAARHENVCCVIGDGAFIINKLMQFFAVRWAELYVPRKWLAYLPKWHISSTLFFARAISQYKRGVKYATLGADLPKLRSKHIFLIAGKRDSYVKPEMTDEIDRRTGGDAEIWIAPKAKHNMARTLNQDEYDRRLVDFVERSFAQNVSSASPS